GVKTTSISGLIIQTDMLSFESPEAITRDPMLLMRIFEESARLKVPLSAEGRRLCHDFLHLVDASFLSSPDSVKAFERILTLATRDFNVLDDMLTTGFLTRWIPQMSNIINLIQYDEYHLYPVDRHTLKTVQNLKNVGAGYDTSQDPLCMEFYHGLKNRKLLLWAALLHDIGKGQAGKNHAAKGADIARAILAQKGYSPQQIETVAFLITQHLFLIENATRRDIDDESTAFFCARKIENIEQLKMLYLLTVADSSSTGPKAYNDWSLTLLRDLTMKVLRILKSGELTSPKTVAAVEKKKRDLIATSKTDNAREKLEAMLTVMSPRYLIYASTQEINEHIRLYERLGRQDFVSQVTQKESSNNRTVTVCATDKSGLFSKMSGAFTLSGFDILDARAFTWTNQVALDIFEVTAPPDYELEDERWEKAWDHLRASLRGEIDLREVVAEKMAAYQPVKKRPKMRPHRVVVDNESSSFFTIVEVYTYDYPGLLFLVTDVFFQERLDVWVAKIATKADQVVDVFYVRTFEEQKIYGTDNEMALKQAILNALEH
ncbi:MAG: HD domain-containing protein, partial [Deltaproteobacteria bacterium]|nr:HD domain-containing protein [Deltaproteobacteria bacterium]